MSENDYCLYYIVDDNVPMFLLTFVDDKDQNKLNKIKGFLFDKYKMKDLGKIKTYLGINVEYEENKNIMSLDQQKYVESLANEYGIGIVSCITHL